MNRKKQLTAAAVAAVMLFALTAGCRNGSADNANDATSVEEQSEYVYTAQSVTLDGDIREFAYSDGKIYLAVENSGIAELYSVNTDGSELGRLENYAPPVELPEDVAGMLYVQKMTADSEGYIWVAEEWIIYRYNLPEGFDRDRDELLDSYIDIVSGNTIRKLDSTGAEIFRIEISDLSENAWSLFISALAVTDNHVYLGTLDYSEDGGSGPALYIFDTDGEIKSILDTGEYFDAQLVKMQDGRAALFTIVHKDSQGNNIPKLQPINDTTGSFDDAVTIPVPGGLSGYTYGSPGVYPGGGSFDFIISDNVNVYGFSLGDDEAVKLFSWLDLNAVVSIIRDIIPLTDEHFVCIDSVWDEQTESYRSKLIIVTQTHRSELPEATTLTLATLFDLPSLISTAVMEFNAESIEYRIEVTNYSEYIVGGDVGAAVSRLTTEIIAGNIPDMIYIPGISMVELMRAGVLTDLYPFLDADAQYGRESFVQAALSVMEYQGSLYQISPGFSLNSIIGHPGILGEGTGWTVEEFMNVLNEHPDADLPLGTAHTREYMLDWIAVMNMSEYIDWDAGVAHFDSPGFIQLLELCNRFPDSLTTERLASEGVTDAQAIADGRQIAMVVSITDFRLIHYYQLLSGGEVVYKGYPTANRDGNMLILGGGLAITEGSANKEAAWQFVRTLIDKDRQLSHQSEFAFPSNREALERMAEQAPIKPANVSIGVFDPNIGGHVEIEMPTPEDVAVIVELIDTASSGAQWNRDAALINIIKEEAANYFSGAVTAEEAAAEIQSRAQLYISERS